MEVASRMRLSGRMAVLTFLHPRATVSEAVEAVKADLLKSLNARSDMHCDSLVGEEVSGAGDEVRPLTVLTRKSGITLDQSRFKKGCDDVIAQWLALLLLDPAVPVFLKVPRSGGEPGIFFIFVYFLSQAAP